MFTHLIWSKCDNNNNIGSGNCSSRAVYYTVQYNKAHIVYMIPKKASKQGKDMSVKPIKSWSFSVIKHLKNTSYYCM